MEILIHIAGLAFIPFFFIAIALGIRDIFLSAPQALPAAGFHTDRFDVLTPHQGCPA